MPQGNMRTARDIKRSIDANRKKTGVRLNYDEMYEDISNALATSEPIERETALIQCHHNIISKIAENYLTRRAMMNSNTVLSIKYHKDPGMLYSLVNITDEVKSWVNDIAMLIDPDYAKDNPVNSKQLKAIRDFQLATLYSHNYSNDVPKCLEKWDRNCYRDEIERVKDMLNDPQKAGHTFGGEANNKDDLFVADMYYKAKLTREELSKHGKFWRFLNFRKVAACEDYLAKADEALNAFGFRAEEHQEAAMKILESTIMPPSDIDVNTINDMYYVELKNALGIVNGKGSFAYDKFTRAMLKDQNPETAFSDVLEPFNKKYDINLTAFDLGYDEDAALNMAVAYDKSKEIALINKAMENAFGKALNAIYVKAMKNGGEVNATDALADARKIAILAAQRYTIFFEAPQNADIESPVYLNGINEAFFRKEIDQCAIESRANLSLKQLEKMKADLVNAGKQMLERREAMVEEDRQVAKSLGSKLPPVKKKEEKSVEVAKRAAVKNPTADHFRMWNKFLDFNFKPEMQIKILTQYDYFCDMIATIIDGNNNLPEGVKKVVELTRAKLLAVTRAIKDAKDKKTLCTATDVAKVCDKLEADAKKSLPEYKKVSAEELLKIKNRHAAEEIMNNPNAENEDRKKINVVMDADHIKEITEKLMMEANRIINEETEKYNKEHFPVPDANVDVIDGNAPKSQKAGTSNTNEVNSKKMFN